MLNSCWVIFTFSLTIPFTGINARPDHPYPILVPFIFYTKCRMLHFFLLHSMLFISLHCLSPFWSLKLFSFPYKLSISPASFPSSANLINVTSNLLSKVLIKFLERACWQSAQYFLLRWTIKNTLYYSSPCGAMIEPILSFYKEGYFESFYQILHWAPGTFNLWHSPDPLN